MKTLNNRVLEFRGWNPETNQMIYGEPLISCRDRIWMQFTGLLDKNGKMIFEGDVVKWNRNDGLNPIRICRIVFSVPNFELRYKDLDDRPAYYNDLSFITVVGNIFENPELLKD